MAGLSLPTFKVSTFGARFLDYDNDGDPDLFVAAGHPFAPVAKVWPESTTPTRPSCSRTRRAAFRDVAGERGAALGRPHVGRGVAVADYDNDGDPDVLLLAAGGRRGCCATTAAPAPLAGRAAGGHPQRPRRRRGAGDRDGGRPRTHPRTVGGASYLTASDPRLLLGLGDSERVSSIEVRWPSGQLDRLPGLPAGRYVTITEGSGRSGAR